MAKQSDLFQKLIESGKKQGFLTYEEISRSIPTGDIDKIDEFIAKLDDLGIKITDDKKTAFALSERAAKNQGSAIEQSVKASSISGGEPEEINTIRMYLNEMSKVPLLNRAVEVELSRNVRENEQQLQSIVLESPIIIKEIKNWEALISQQEMTPKELMPRGRKSKAQLRSMGTKIKKVVSGISEIEGKISVLEKKMKGAPQKEKEALKEKIKEMRSEIINLIISLNLNQDKLKRLTNKIKTTAQKLNEINAEVKVFERKYRNPFQKVKALYKSY
ncbi:MAG: hypothetical protein LBH29_07020, partial [Elusimicrobiota bacterium]|nr:hypothetical protein [Elusimicrobiota bacterium]